MKKVSIYTTPTCTYCAMAKALFKEKGVAYDEFNVATDIEKRKEMIEKSGQMGVPVIEIGDQIMVGFSREKIEELLA